ncbi:Proline-rich receptor-like protein kinase PERK14 [Triticum urartu]|uniref:Proline-rich receptor-like protein kinase PERK14 n=1 Tax=Triticum urartu TaxID=4572 RepID=M7YYQ2_TRIUA|nr:Proline-rich receptor-like protein kinase PERK14 [Triticum urartu]
MAMAITVHHVLLALALIPLAAAQQEYQANAQPRRTPYSPCGPPGQVAPPDGPPPPPPPPPAAARAAGRSQHDAAYAVQFVDETYFSIADDTYQGLSTCQALMAQNPVRDSDIHPGVALTVPLRCACPSAAQAAAGVRYLVTYVLDWDDNAFTVAQRFGADYQALLHANGITDDTTVYPFTTMLVPLKDPPTSQIPVVLPAPPAAPPAPASDLVPTASSSESSRWWITVGVGAGCSALALGAVLALFLLWRRCCRHGDRNTKTAPWQAPAKGALMWPTVEAVDVREAVWSLTVHDYGDLERATSGFSEEQRLGNSSVYRAVINGGAAAVKRVPGDDMGAETEVSVLGRPNHSSLICLSGLCMHGGNTYMVLEFAENGALSDWLRFNGGEVLGWSQRVQVALDVAGGLNYLHNYTDPPYVHRNLKSSNILLDACFRAKLSNFGLARAITVDADDDDIGLWMTRNVVGTQGYLAPEYLEHGLIGPQLDVFAFGVVLLELLSGKEAAVAPDNDGKVVLLWEEAEGLGRLGDGDSAKDDLLDRVTAFIDGRLGGQYPLDVAVAMLALALRHQIGARQDRAWWPDAEPDGAGDLRQAGAAAPERQRNEMRPDAAVSPREAWGAAGGGEATTAFAAGGEAQSC